jgi:hypothetical protein
MPIRNFIRLRNWWLRVLRWKSNEWGDGLMIWMLENTFSEIDNCIDLN